LTIADLRLPIFCFAHAMNVSTLAVLATSSSCQCAAAAPALRDSAATFFKRSTRRAPSSTFAPSAPNACAAAAPNPLEAPVINTHLFFKLVFISREV